MWFPVCQNVYLKPAEEISIVVYMLLDGRQYNDIIVHFNQYCATGKLNINTTYTRGCHALNQTHCLIMIWWKRLSRGIRELLIHRGPMTNALRIVPPPPPRPFFDFVKPEMQHSKNMQTGCCYWKHHRHSNLSVSLGPETWVWSLI